MPGAFWQATGLLILSMVFVLTPAVVAGVVSVLAVLLYGTLRGGWLDAVLAGVGALALDHLRRNPTSASLIILDLDSFKEYNDKWGHPAGDVRLREVANLLRLNVREPDVAARYGGEEFAVIVPGSPLSGVLALAERLREAVEALPLPEGRVSISVGVGYLHPPALATAEQLLADALVAMASLCARASRRFTGTATCSGSAMWRSRSA